MKNTVIAVRALKPVSNDRGAASAQARRRRAILEFDCSCERQTATSGVAV